MNQTSVQVPSNVPANKIHQQALSPAMPRHVAIIMDGNNRWLKQHGGKELDGHIAGVDAARRIIKFCGTRGIPCLTLFAFSSENWQRPQKEVSGLMELFARFLQKKEVQQLHDNNVCLRFIGNRTRFSPKLQMLMRNAEALTAGNSGLCVVVAADYGGHWDITNAARQIAREVAQGKLDPDDIDEQFFHKHVASSDLPVPDLCIRTGGEIRISNFLLWQLAYAELYFTNTWWPDFDEVEFDHALTDYARRQRRFGRVSEQLDQAGLAGQ
jgi:undecaprenyl diphosphate synthase